MELRLIGGAALAAAAAVAYGNSLGGPFVLDDSSSISGNPTIQHGWRLWRALAPPRGGGLTVEGRPILNLSFAFNFAVGGAHPWGYHLLNLAIHTAAALVLFGAIRRVSRNAAFAWAVALLWLVHPLNTEAVTYVAQRAESLMGLFYLLTVYCFIRGVAPAQSSAANSDASEPPGPREHWLILSVFACALGAATKEVMVSAPLVVLLADRRWFAGSLAGALGRRKGYYAALGGSWVLLAALAWSAGSRGGTSGFGSGVPVSRYWPMAPLAIAHYLRLSLWPSPLVFDYGPLRPASVGQVLAPGLLVAALLAVTIHGLRRNQVSGILGFVFFAILAPTCLVPGNRQTLAEQRMYLALIPVIAAGILAGGQLFRRALPNFATTRALIALAVVLAAPEVAMTRARNRDYASALRLFADTAAKAPGNPYAQSNYGTALLAAGLYEASVGRFEAALTLDPGLSDAECNLGNALSHLGRLSDAEVHYRRAIGLDPRFAEPHAALGIAFLRQGRLGQARSEFEAATRLAPGDEDAHVNLGNALRESGAPEAALAEFARASAISPGDGRAQYDWAGALMDLRRYPEAERHLAAAIRLAPENASARQNLGNVLLAEGRPGEAVEQYEAAVRLAPDRAAAHYNLANGLLRLGRREAAIAEFRQALALQPNLTPAREMLRAIAAPP